MTPKRLNFINIQTSHHVPCANGEAGRVRTGYEQVIAHRTQSDMYAQVAKQDGTIININEKLNLATVKYKDGTTEVIDYNTKQGNVGGIFINHDCVLNVELGEKIKTGDVLSYNPGFFIPNATNKQVSWKQGVHANVLIMESDTTYEDSSAISKRLGEELTMKPTELRSVKITNKTVIHDMKKVGDPIKNSDILCIIEDEDIESLSIAEGIDDEALTILNDFNRKSPKTKHNGIISHIEVYYSCELETMHHSIQNFIKKIITTKRQKTNYSKGSRSEGKYTTAIQVKPGSKIKMTEFGEDTILIHFFITEEIPSGVGDKVVFDSSLKSVIAAVLDKPIVSETGREIDAIFSATSINNRVILSPLKCGLMNLLLEKAEQDILDIFFDK